MISGGRRKLHYLYPDNTEKVEEFDINTAECLRKFFLDVFYQPFFCSEEMEKTKGVWRGDVVDRSWV